MITLGVSLLVVATLAPVHVFSQVPDFISFQGRLANDDGDLIDDTADLTIKLYQNGSEVYSQMLPNVAVDNGTFNVDLGPLAGVTFDQPTELGVTVDTDSEIWPQART